MWNGGNHAIAARDGARRRHGLFLRRSLCRAGQDERLHSCRVKDLDKLAQRAQEVEVSIPL